MYMVYIWVSIIAAGLLLEAVEAGSLVTIWFSVGAIIPLIMSFFGITTAWYIVVEVIVFGFITVLSLVFLRKIAKRTLLKNSKEKTNMEIYIGKKFKISRIDEDNDIFYIKLNGVEYRVVSENEENFALGDQVELLSISGNKVIVKKVEQKGEI